MADDGMLLNFEFGDAPFKPQIKFQGGRWRDRIRAQKSTRPRPPQHDSLPAGTRPLEPSSNDKGGPEPPAKRQKTGSSSSRPAKSESHANPRGVTSRLFSSNPTPTTAPEKPSEQDTEPAEPSNAPLSEEAATFHALGLSRRIAQHLSAKLELKAPTAIQKHTIPHLIGEDSDAFLQAETGSGKTLAYLLPIVHRIIALSQADDGLKDVKIHRNSGLFAIVLAPTRELCKQIAAVAEKLLRCAPWIVSTVVMGGESKKSEKARLRKGVNILIATPGRLTDHLDHTEVLDVSTVRWLVLDEGDRLMELGFEDDIRAIVGAVRKQDLKKESSDGLVFGDDILPSRRVTVLCSATMKMNVQKLGEISLQDAVHITATSATDGKETAGASEEAVFSAPSQLKQSYVIVPAKLRLVTLISLLKSTFARKGSVMKAIVFISCADSVDFHFNLLKTTKPPNLEAEPAESPSPKKDGPPSLTASTVSQAAYLTSPANQSVVLCKLHGSLPQPVRTSTLASFSKEASPAVLITTDISSRGLDVSAVDLVVEYDPAFSVADHLHRIGRTARAGRPGKAVLFLQPGCEEGYVSLLRSSSSSAIASQLYEEILQKGLASAVELPAESGDGDGAAVSQRQKQSWTSRAESLQLHLEQRLLVVDQAPEIPVPRKSSGRNPPKANESKLLEAARKAFRSHIRAYATHVRDERVFFDIMQLHLGHMAKSFGLREAPGGIGGGVQRRTHRPAKSGQPGDGRRGADYDDGGGAGDGRNHGVDEDAARRMKAKMKVVMRAADEFNIG